MRLKQASKKAKGKEGELPSFPGFLKSVLLDGEGCCLEDAFMKHGVGVAAISPVLIADGAIGVRDPNKAVVLAGQQAAFHVGAVGQAARDSQVAVAAL